MADNSYKINKSVNFNPQAAAPANPLDGDFFFDATAQSFAYFHDGYWANVDSVGILSATEPMTGAQFTPAVVRNALVKVTGASTPKHLDGISASHTGKSIKIYNAGTSYITVEHEDSGEPTANNRIRTPTAGDMNLIAGEVATFTYDIIANRWLLVSISSQAGAQLIATTSSPGLVTLHQASLFPADGIVLSDGDLNTATGVVGLDANRAAAIIAPTSAVNTLTLTAHASASALSVIGATGGSAVKIKGGTSGGTIFEWINAANTSLGIIDAGGNFDFATSMSFQFAGDGELDFTGIGTITFLDPASAINFPTVTVMESEPDCFSVLEAGHVFFRLQNNANFANLRCKSPTDAVIYDFYANEGEAAVQLRATTNHPMSFYTNNVKRWTISAAGTLLAEGTNRFIQNVLDPVLPQDAATKNYANSRNIIHNGNMAIWQRGPTAKTSAAQNTVAWGARLGRADRWLHRFEITGAGSGGNNTFSAGMNTTNILKYPYALQNYLVAKQTGSPAGWLWTYQEIDRAAVYQARGKTLTLDLKMCVGSGWGVNMNLKVVIKASNGNRYANISNLGGTVTTLFSHTYTTVSSSISTAPTYGDYQYVTTTLVPNDATTISVGIAREVSSFEVTGSTADLNITGAVLRIGDFTAAVPAEEYPFAGKCQDTELDICQRYYENTSQLGNDYRPTNETGTGSGAAVISIIGQGGYVAYPWRTRKLGSFQNLTATMKVWSGSGGAADKIYNIATTADQVVSYTFSDAAEHQLYIEGQAGYPAAVSFQAEMDCDFI